MGSFNLHIVEELKQNKQYNDLFAYCRFYALQNDVEAMVQLSNCFYHGWGTRKNEKESALLDLQAAKLGYVKAVFNLAVDYEQGIGVQVNPKKAFELYELAAQKQDPDSLYHLGLCYFHGKGHKKDLEKAVQYFSEAALQGQNQAQCSLGFCYLKGLGVEPSVIQAEHWLNKAADQGNELAAKYVHRNIDQERIHENLDDVLSALKDTIPLLKGNRNQVIDEKIKEIQRMILQMNESSSQEEI